MFKMVSSSGAALTLCRGRKVQTVAETGSKWNSAGRYDDCVTWRSLSACAAVVSPEMAFDWRIQRKKTRTMLSVEVMSTLYGIRARFHSILLVALWWRAHYTHTTLLTVASSSIAMPLFDTVTLFSEYSWGDFLFIVSMVRAEWCTTHQRAHRMSSYCRPNKIYKIYINRIDSACTIQEHEHAHTHTMGVQRPLCQPHWIGIEIVSFVHTNASIRMHSQLERTLKNGAFHNTLANRKNSEQKINVRLRGDTVAINRANEIRSSENATIQIVYAPCKQLRTTAQCIPSTHRMRTASPIPTSILLLLGHAWPIVCRVISLKWWKWPQNNDQNEFHWIGVWFRYHECSKRKAN